MSSIDNQHKKKSFYYWSQFGMRLCSKSVNKVFYISLILNALIRIKTLYYVLIPFSVDEDALIYGFANLEIIVNRARPCRCPNDP